MLVFSQFADTVDYLEAQLKKRGMADMAGVTGRSADPTQLAWRFSPYSNQRPGQAKPEREFRVRSPPDVLSEGQNLQDSHVVVNYDLPWAIIRLIQRAGRVDRIGQNAERFSATPSYRSRASSALSIYGGGSGNGSGRMPKWSARTKRSSRTKTTIRPSSTYITSAPVSSTATPEGDVDLASHAYQIWKNAVGADPSLEKAVADLPDVVFSSRDHTPIAQRPEGVLVYMRTSDGNDALAYVDREGKSITESQLEILSAAECKPGHSASASPREPPQACRRGRKACCQRGKASRGASWDGPPAPAFALTPRLKTYAAAIRGQLFDVDALHKAIDDIYRYPLRPLAVDTLNRQLRRRRRGRPVG